MLLLPGSAGASPATDDLERRAVALDDRGDDVEAAPLWEALARETEDDDARLVAYARALAAWERAYQASRDARHLCAARTILARALADERVIDPGRRELVARRAALEVDAVDCPRPRVPMLADPIPPTPGPSTPGMSTPPIEPSVRSDGAPIDAPRRSRKTIAGVAMIALAAPALGGFIYAAAEDRAIVRGFRRLGADYDATHTYDDAEAQRLAARALIVRDLEIGLGVTALALTGAAIGLLVVGHREPARSSISILPQARADLGGLVLRGRF